MADGIKNYLIDRIDINHLTGCWNWKRSLAGYRYGLGWFNGKRIWAHRASYEIFVGKIPKGLNVCHKCDNTKCINPSHLFLGTQKENMRDCSKKGRLHAHSGSFKPGQEHRMAKISNEQFIEIKRLLKMGEKQVWIAKEFNVNQSTISDIKRNNWKKIGV